MTDDPTPETESRADEFESRAQSQNAGLGREIWDLIRHNKKWWLLPIIIVLLLIGLVLLLSSSALAPFIYPLF